jgi:two-component system chemotaxis response regulator CheY
MNTDIYVLVVDDDWHIRENITHHLKKMGFSNIVTADTGASAFQQAIVKNFGLILSDWNMPDMDGLELLKNIRGIPSLASTPFLMITSNSDKQSVINAIKGGVEYYIVKPFEGKTLRNKIEEILG